MKSSSAAKRKTGFSAKDNSWQLVNLPENQLTKFYRVALLNDHWDVDRMRQPNVYARMSLWDRSKRFCEANSLWSGNSWTRLLGERTVAKVGDRSLTGNPSTGGGAETSHHTSVKYVWTSCHSNPPPPPLSPTSYVSGGEICFEALLSSFPQWPYCCFKCFAYPRVTLQTSKIISFVFSRTWKNFESPKVQHKHFAFGRRICLLDQRMLCKHCTLDF